MLGKLLNAASCNTILITLIFISLVSWSISAGNMSGLMIPQVTVVLSHCQHDLAWLRSAISEIPVKEVVIYSKCGGPVLGVPQSIPSRVVRSSNIGRCDHSYASFILDLHAKDEVILFMKDTYHVHWLYKGKSIDNERGIMGIRSYAQMIDIATGPAQFSCRQFIREASGMSDFVVTKQLLRLSIAEYNESLYSYSRVQSEPFAIHRDMLNWTKELKIFLPKPIAPVCYGGVFAVKAQRLNRFHKSFWLGIVKSLSRADNIQESHFMERSWAGLLSLESVPVFGKPVLCLKQAICGYRGHLIFSKKNILKHKLCWVKMTRFNNAIRNCPSASFHKTKVNHENLSRSA